MAAVRVFIDVGDVAIHFVFVVVAVVKLLFDFCVNVFVLTRQAQLSAEFVS